MTADSAPGLRGRRGECDVLDRLVAGLRTGESQVLVLRGEAGIGKTALLRALLARSSGCRVARTAGVESEMELAFAGLQQLCSPFLDRLERLPGPQRDALGTAFGLRDGDVPDRFLVGLAVLSLLADVAEEQPLICVIDDAQWLDRSSAQALEFVARRLLAESVAIVFAVRESGDEQSLPGLSELVVGGLSDPEARSLLDSVITGPLDERVRDRLVAETHGNPLALLELPRGMTPVELAGGFGLPDALPLAGRIEQGFLRRLEPLASDTRRLLLTAAVEPVGDVGLLWRAAELLGIGSDAAAPAKAAGLIELGSQVRFRHPLVRSAARRDAGALDLQEVHRALADATDPAVDPDRRAWHRAHATSGLDETVAAELESSAGRAQMRGGWAAAAAFLERATELTADPARRAPRALAAARGKLQAGAPDAALGLLAVARVGPLDELQRAHVDLVHADIAFATNRGRDAPPLLLKAAKQLESLDVGLARATYLTAFTAAWFVGRLAGDVDVVDVARAARSAPAPAQVPRKEDVLLDSRAVTFTEGFGAATPISKRAIRAFCAEDVASEEGLRWLWLTTAVAADLWDHDSWRILCERHVSIAREAGALSELALALNTSSLMSLVAGEVAAAASLIDEARAVTEAIGSNFGRQDALILAAWRGRDAEARDLTEAIMSEVVPRGEGIVVTVVQWANAVLFNGVGRYEQALAAAEAGCAYPLDQGFSTWSLVELVEAATRTGEPARAAAALTRLSEMTHAAGTDWALGIEARCRALVSDGETAEGLYRAALDHLGRARLPVDLARARLLFGEWLRRAGRRTDAREHLRAAHEMFAEMGMEGFAERARRELMATGETVRKRSVETIDDLTAQEAQIARLARDGRTNPEIGAELFISPRTVEWHLRKVFAKLDIGSRKELGAALPGAGGERRPGH